MDLLETLKSSLEERPVIPSPLPASGEDLLTSVATSPLSLSTWLKRYVPDGCSGKTSPVSCPATEDGTLVPSSGRWGNSGMGGPTESWTLNTLEFHSGAAASFLSEVLEVQPLPERYYLSPKACAGILRRAEKRGKKLKAPLAAALESVAGHPTQSE